MVGGMRVTPETVLGIYEVIMEEVNRLRMAIRNFQREHRSMPPLGGDPVSVPAAKGFNEATALLVQSCQKHVDGLEAVGSQLAAAAREYGRTEEQITAALKQAMSVAYQPSSTPGAQ